MEINDETMTNVGLITETRIYIHYEEFRAPYRFLSVDFLNNSEEMKFIFTLDIEFETFETFIDI